MDYWQKFNHLICKIILSILLFLGLGVRVPYVSASPNCRRLQKPAYKTPPDLPIKAAIKPQGQSPLSGVVVIYDMGRHGHSYIRFTDEARQRIAKHMPRGIGPAEPAYLQVEHELECYAVYCMYVSDRAGRLLWRHDSLPPWIDKIKYVDI